MVLLKNQNISCENMASSLINKANARLKFLYRNRHFLTEHTKKLLVSAFIQCHFDYTCSFWYNRLTKHWKSKFQVTQNKLVRFVLNLDQRAYIEHNHLKQLNWLPVKDRVNQIILFHVFKTVLSSGYILILLSIEYILASLIKMCQG